MSVVKKLLEITGKLQEHLIKGLPKGEGREEHIDKIDHYLKLREDLLSNLPTALTEEEKQYRDELLLLNEKIQPLLNKYKQLIKKEIIQLKNRKQTQRYANPYSGPTGDGMFLDKKS